MTISRRESHGGAPAVSHLVQGGCPPTEKVHGEALDHVRPKYANFPTHRSSSPSASSSVIRTTIPATKRHIVASDIGNHAEFDRGRPTIRFVPRRNRSRACGDDTAMCTLGCTTTRPSESETSLVRAR